MSPTVVVPRRFCGPDTSGHGGWTSGAVAAHVAAPVAAHVAAPVAARVAEVTLRTPPPLDTEMAVIAGDAGTVTVHDGETLVAEGRPAQLDLPVLPPPSDEQVAAAPVAPEWTVDRHPFARCFCCGPAREPGDGLRIFPHTIDEGLSPRFATEWVPGPDVAGPDGVVHPAVVWAALDCPTAFPFMEDGTFASMLLGRMTAELLEPVRAGERLVVTSWGEGRDGRKHFGCSALFATPAAGEAGRSVRLVARARSTWIAVDR